MKNNLKDIRHNYTPLGFIPGPTDKPNFTVKETKFITCRTSQLFNSYRCEKNVPLLLS